MQALYQEISQELHDDVVTCTSLHQYFLLSQRDMKEIINLRFPPITELSELQTTVENTMLRNEQQVNPLPVIKCFCQRFINCFRLNVQISQLWCK